MHADPLDELTPEEQEELGADLPWPELVSLEADLPPVEPFDESWLPETLRPTARDIAERMQVPLDFPAVSLLCTLAGAVNRRAVIQPKAKDGTWTVVPNVWGGIIAPPGFMKTPAIAAATKPLRAIEDEHLAMHKTALAEYEFTLEQYELKHQAWREKSKSAYKSGKDLALPPPDLPPEEPTVRRLLVNDTTYEKLQEIMRENPAGVMLCRDELSGWWATLDRPGREGERAFYLETWNGNTGYTVDRVGRGSIHLPACCLTMLGGIQPSKLRFYLTDTLNGGPTDDGLIQRFQLLVWPDLPEGWESVDREPDSRALLRVETILRALDALPVDTPLYLKFSPEAQALFNVWLADLEAKVRSKDIHPALAGHLSKFRKTMPSLALLFELADRAAIPGFEGFVASLQGHCAKIGEVSLEHAKKAAAWVDYLETHAKRIYSCVVAPQTRAAHVLAMKIKDGKIGKGGVFSLRAVYLKGWAGVDTPQLARQAAEVLEDAGWIRSFEDGQRPQGGRPSDTFQVNPQVNPKVRA